MGSVAIDGGLARKRRADEEGDFAASGFFLEGSGEFGEGTAKKFFMDFGDFTGEAGAKMALASETVSATR